MLFEITMRNKGKRLKKFWVLYVEGNINGSRKYYTQWEAEEEAERLAIYGRKVYLLECVARCRAEGSLHGEQDRTILAWEMPED